MFECWKFPLLSVNKKVNLGIHIVWMGSLNFKVMFSSKSSGRLINNKSSGCWFYSYCFVKNMGFPEFAPSWFLTFCLYILMIFSKFLPLTSLKKCRRKRLTVPSSFLSLLVMDSGMWSQMRYITVFISVSYFMSLTFFTRPFSIGFWSFSIYGGVWIPIG